MTDRPEGLSAEEVVGQIIEAVYKSYQRGDEYPHIRHSHRRRKIIEQFAPLIDAARDSRPVGEGLDVAIERLADGYLSAISANATGRFRRDLADLRRRLTDQPASTEVGEDG